MVSSDLDKRIKTLAQWMYEAKRLIVFTGAGISTESGLPDFRGPDGIWTRQAKGLPTEWPDLSLAEPNAGHMAIVELQKLGKLSFLISQNIDNLHLRSGIHPDLLAELHGYGVAAAEPKWINLQVWILVLAVAGWFPAWLRTP